MNELRLLSEVSSRAVVSPKNVRHSRLKVAAFSLINVGYIVWVVGRSFIARQNFFVTHPGHWFVLGYLFLVTFCLFFGDRPLKVIGWLMIGLPLAGFLILAAMFSGVKSFG
ncbi:hypothetical protein J2Y55_001272 [Bosea sp. BE125]|uniref:hypothetical protein n=1 Tax=Bosea sp. BE125 TaxID=2817909 RepID=UPI002854256E|nr:hypothetical protein [Bosea sp. BE125]MDR6870272.1 hypothetical protein [Bosea sp. BE125]